MATNPISKLERLTIAEAILFYGVGAEFPRQSCVRIQDRDKTPERFIAWYSKNHPTTMGMYSTKYPTKMHKTRKLQRRNEIHHVPLLMLADAASEILIQPTLNRQVASVPDICDTADDHGVPPTSPVLSCRPIGPLHFEDSDTETIEIENGEIQSPPPLMLSRSY